MPNQEALKRFDEQLCETDGEDTRLVEPIHRIKSFISNELNRARIEAMIEVSESMYNQFYKGQLTESLFMEVITKLRKQLEALK